jgi:PTH2 family peptidyl-tRNA hydrolase
MDTNVNLNRDWKQYVIVNKSLHMSSGKMSAQVSHATMAFLTRGLQKSVVSVGDDSVTCVVTLGREMWDNWISGVFTKVCLEAKDDSHMEKIVQKLIDNGFKENVDFFKIVDVGTTEFHGEPHWTCIGLAPMDSKREDLQKVVKRLQVYHE